MTYPKQVWEYDKEELAEMYAIAQCEIERLTKIIDSAMFDLDRRGTEIERLRTALHDLRKAYIFWVGDKGDGEALARANALLDVYEQSTTARLDCRLCGQTYGFGEKHVCDR